MSESLENRIALVVGSGPHHEAIVQRLSEDGLQVQSHRLEVSPDDLAQEDPTPYALVLVLGPDLEGPREGWGEEFRTAVSQPLRQVYALTRALARVLMRARRGRMVFVVSAEGLIGGTTNPVLTLLSGAVAGMARSVARELAPRNVLINTVAYSVAPESTALGRATTSEEVAGAVSYLCSEAGGGVCGQVLAVDGGLVMR